MKIISSHYVSLNGYILCVIVVLFIVSFNMTVVENVFNNKFGYSSNVYIHYYFCYLIVVVCGLGSSSYIPLPAN